MVIFGPSRRRFQFGLGSGKQGGLEMYVPCVDGLVSLMGVTPKRGMFRAFAILTEVLRHALQRDHQGNEV